MSREQPCSTDPKLLVRNPFIDRDWPSWCREHQRLHIRHHWLCLTARERRYLRRMRTALADLGPSSG